MKSREVTDWKEAGYSTFFRGFSYFAVKLDCHLTGYGRKCCKLAENIVILQTQSFELSRSQH